MAQTSSRVRNRTDDGMDDMMADAEAVASTATASGGRQDNASVQEKLKSVGVDTDVMASAAKDQASELQRLLTDELRIHPMRTLGVAAAVGLFVGLMSGR